MASILTSRRESRNAMAIRSSVPASVSMMTGTCAARTAAMEASRIQARAIRMRSRYVSTQPTTPHPVQWLRMETRRMCPHCRAFITTKDRTCPYCHESVGARAVDVDAPASVLGGLIPHARFATAMILLINFGLYLVTVVHSMGLGNSGAFMDLDLQTLYQFGGKFRS